MFPKRRDIKIKEIRLRMKDLKKKSNNSFYIKWNNGKMKGPRSLIKKNICKRRKNSLSEAYNKKRKGKVRK